MSNPLNKNIGKYVLIEWDGVLSENPEMVFPLLNLLNRLKYKTKIFTFRNESDNNSDIFSYLNEKDVFFSNKTSKKDLIHSFGLKHKKIAYWIDSEFRNIVDKEDLEKMLQLINSPDFDKEKTLSEIKAPKKEVPEDFKKYVMIDWDDTMSRSAEYTARFFALFERFGYTPKIFTARNDDGDNYDILAHVDKANILYANRKQKKEALSDYDIHIDEVAFWLDDMPSAVISKADFYKSFSYFNR